MSKKDEALKNLQLAVGISNKIAQGEVPIVEVMASAMAISDAIEDVTDYVESVKEEENDGEDE